ncbi:MAG: L-histidine N(alpha)-methyltransferase [Steroidobacter sp.]
MAKKPNLVPANPADALTADVIEGLKKEPKELSPVWFYDELGSFLFDNICELPEYYITRTELQIMHGYASEMAQVIGPEAAMIEFGSGTSMKTRLLLDRLESPVAYVPVDISREHLFTAAGALAKDYPNLHIAPICADFTQSFELPSFIRAAQRRVVYFPGSTIGNFDRPQARQLLVRMRELVGKHGAVLIGTDLRKDPKVLERAYDDAAGVTAEFNINALRHLNRELGSNFDLDAFDHLAVWVEDDSRIEMHLVSKRDQVVQIGDEKVRFERGEHLRTEYCHKYTLETFNELAATAGLAVKRVWTDPNQMFSVQLLEPVRLQ